MVGVIVVMVTSFRRTNALIAVSSATDHTASHFLPIPPRETPGHTQASPAQSLVGTPFLFPGSWCAQGFVCVLQESLFPVLWKFYNEIPLVFKVKFPGGSQSLCWILRLGNLLQALELLKQCENFFVIIVLQFVVVCSVAL